MAVAALFALVAGFQVVRTAIVSAETRGDPRLISSLWAGHPDVLAKSAMLGVANSAVTHKPLDRATLAKVEELARVAPLAPEPFLIEGAVAQRAARRADAERLLIQARLRDPRNAGVRYLLATNDLESGKILDAIREMVALRGLLPGPNFEVSEALANYGKTPGAIATLRQIFKEHAVLEPQVLSLLAANPANAELVMTLASARPGTSDMPAPEWQGVLLTKLVDGGQYDKAHSLWRRLSGFSDTGSIFNPQFARIGAPPPFNWSFANSGAGLAEPADGALRVLYFGREDIALASQVLLLGPGAYQLGSRAAGDLGSSGSLRWNLKCLPGKSVLLDIPLRSSWSGGKFRIPEAGCRAQQLQLMGKSQEFSDNADVRLSGLQLRKMQ